jgi:sporulation protein YunB
MDVNSKKANELLIEASKLLEQNLKYLEMGEIDKLKVNGLNINSNKKGIIYELPSGIIFNNLFLNNLLPKIPVRLNLVGTIFCKLTTDVESYGINNAIFRVNITATTTVKVVLPFTSKNVALEATIPIITKIIEGEVPNYYFGGYN